jgi:hypothetical protein
MSTHRQVKDRLVTAAPFLRGEKIITFLKKGCVSLGVWAKTGVKIIHGEGPAKGHAEDWWPFNTTMNSHQKNARISGR